MGKKELPGELTMQEAANVLGVLELELVRLVEDEALPLRRVAANRQVRTDDVLALKGENSSRRAATRRLTEDAQDLGLEY